jgi:uncharacterized protein YjeT (DUF2065 family)
MMDDPLRDLGLALALVLVIEGLLYALFPKLMHKLMTYSLSHPPSALRWAGLAAAAVGVGMVWVVRRVA